MSPWRTFMYVWSSKIRKCQKPKAIYVIYKTFPQKYRSMELPLEWMCSGCMYAYACMYRLSVPFLEGKFWRLIDQWMIPESLFPSLIHHWPVAITSKFQLRFCCTKSSRISSYSFKNRLHRYVACVLRYQSQPCRILLCSFILSNSSHLILLFYPILQPYLIFLSYLVFCPALLSHMFASVRSQR